MPDTHSKSAHKPQGWSDKSLTDAGIDPAEYRRSNAERLLQMPPEWQAARQEAIAYYCQWLPRVQSKEDFDAIPSGRAFIASDGKIRWKP